jgi:hypothetical protein
MAVYQRAMEGISDKNGRHVIILTTLPNIDQWAVSLVQCVNTAREFIGTKVQEGIITLRIRYEEVTNEVIEMRREDVFEELSWEATWNLIDEMKDEVKDEVNDEVKDKVNDEVNGRGRMKEREKGREPDGPEKKSRQAITRHPVLSYQHIKIDDEERQISDQYCSFPHRPRSCLIPILKMLPLNLLRLLILLLLAYLICSDEFLSSVYIGSRTRSDDPCSEEW